MQHSHSIKEKAALVARLNRIKGQIEGITKMVRDDTDCPEILMQVVAVRRAMKSFGDSIVHSHMHECIDHAQNQAESKKKLHSFLTVLERYVS